MSRTPADVVAGDRRRHAELDDTELLRQIVRAVHGRIRSQDEPGRSRVGQRLLDLLSEQARRHGGTSDEAPRGGGGPDAVARPLAEPALSAGGSAQHAAAAGARRLLPAAGDRSLQTTAALAARLLSAEAAEVSLVTDVRTIAAAAGVACTRTGEQTPLQEALCTLAAVEGAPLVVFDARRDERVARSGPVLRGEVGAYLGVPLLADDGGVVGALCVYERAPRAWTPAEQDLLRQIGVAVAAQLEVAALDAAFTSADRQVLLAGAAHAAGIGSFAWDVAADVLVWDDPLLVTFGYADAEFPGDLEAFTSRVHPDDRDRVEEALRAAIEACGDYAADFRAVRPDGSTRRLRARGRAREDAGGGVHVLGAVTDVTAGRARDEQTTAVLESMLVGYLSLDADWRITYLNAEAERVLASGRQELLGRSLWEVFPAAVGTVFEESYRRAAGEQVDVVFDAYYPQPLDMWFEVRATPEGEGLAVYFVDVTERQRAYQARDVAARRLQRFTHFTLAVDETQTIEELVRTVAEEGLTELGCNGGAVAVLDPADADTLRSYLASDYGDDAQVHYGRLPLSVDLPVGAAARTGQVVLVGDRDACLAFSPEMEDVLEVTGAQAFASLPLRAGGRVLGVVTAGWEAAQSFDDDQLDMLQTFAAQVAQALQRLQALEAERAAARRVAGMSEALQRSLLAELPEPDHLELVARYVPAADEAQVGGDWYDAFLVRDGATSLVIGDVTGHDQRAAVQMAQVRNVLRGIAHAVVEPPAKILHALDWAMRDLAVGALATTILAKVEQGAGDAARGMRILRWSNAGHLPPLLVHPDGRTEVLQRPADLLLGLGPDVERHDHTQQLAPGATVLLFTDGLVERRGEHLDVGLARLAETTGHLAHLPLQQLCDELLRLLGAGSEDDVALLAIRAHPEDRPRPAEAGPGTLPADLTRTEPVFPQGPSRT